MSDDREMDSKRVRVYQLAEGWTAVAGRTDADNDYVSLKLAHPADLWFHASGCPGSHVLLLHRDGLTPDREAVRAAAAVAAWHSKARKAKRVAVHVTEAENVGKRRGAPRGEVTLKRFRTVKATPGLPEGE